MSNVWVKTKDRLPPDGFYYVKKLMNNGNIGKGCENYLAGEWNLGSGHFIVNEIIEWLDEGIEYNKDYEILSVLWVFNHQDINDTIIQKVNGMFRVNLGKEFTWTDEQMLKNECIEIHSVKRLLDGEIFTIGDKITVWRNSGYSGERTIESFKITDGVLKEVDELGESDLQHIYKSTGLPPKEQPKEVDTVQWQSTRNIGTAFYGFDVVTFNGKEYIDEKAVKEWFLKTLLEAEEKWYNIGKGVAYQNSPSFSVYIQSLKK
jgi:hypothetical protein